MKAKWIIYKIAVIVMVLGWVQAWGQEYKSLAGTHHIVISSPINQISVGETITMNAISNKKYTDFVWSSEYPGIASVVNGKVIGLDKGKVLITAKAKGDSFEAAYLLTITGPEDHESLPLTTEELYYNNPQFNRGEKYTNKGILLFPADVNEVPNWPSIAAKSGLNTIGIHPGGGHLEGIMEGTINWLKSDYGQLFLKNCRRYGIEVEYEIHAIKELLPREMFNKYPTMFRMDKNGLRQQEDNFCIHSKQALELLAKNVVAFAKIATPTTGRYYFWIDDGRHMCHPDIGDIYSDSDQALMMENYLLRELRKFDPRATIAHLTYANTSTPPKKIKPDNGVFLEFVPITRSYDMSYRNQSGDRSTQDNSGWVYLKQNLEIFPANTAQILEYWTDVSLFSNWKRPFKELPWKKINKVLEDDVTFYREFGIPNFTSFGNGHDENYLKNYGFKHIEEYSKALQD